MRNIFFTLVGAVALQTCQPAIEKTDKQGNLKDTTENTKEQLQQATKNDKVVELVDRNVYSSEVIYIQTALKIVNQQIQSGKFNEIKECIQNFDHCTFKTMTIEGKNYKYFATINVQDGKEIIILLSNDTVSGNAGAANPNTNNPNTFFLILNAPYLTGQYFGIIKSVYAQEAYHTMSKLNLDNPLENLKGEAIGELLGFCFPQEVEKFVELRMPQIISGYDKNAHNSSDIEFIRAAIVKGVETKVPYTLALSLYFRALYQHLNETERAYIDGKCQGLTTHEQFQQQGKDLVQYLKGQGRWSQIVQAMTKTYGELAAKL